MELKFRVWKEWSKKFEYIDSNYHLGYWACDAGHGPDRKLSEFNWQVFTGLKDKNGKEIYEGDYVQIAKNIVYKVLWTDSMVSDHEWYGACFVLVNEAVAAFPFDEYAIKHAEVIGNVYEGK